MKKAVFLMAAGVLLASGAVAQTAKLGDKAAPLSVKEWIEGGPADALDGKHIYVVEFWAAWYPPCRTSIPHLTELQKKFKDKGVVFIGVSAEALRRGNRNLRKRSGVMSSMRERASRRPRPSAASF